MKRKREMEKESEIQSAIEELSMLIQLKTSDNHDKIGPTMAVLRQDINQNVERIELQCDSDPSLYSNLVEILKKEADEGNARKGTSCSKAFVWLTRSLDFTVALLQRLVKNPDQEMEEAVKDSYNITLKPWHGWISSAAYRVALKLIPDTKSFINLLKPKDENTETLIEDMETFISLLVPILEEIHPTLTLYRLDKLKST
ncbi:glycolipid transfer protein 3 isoform X3 [Manihot esculenta]|uniref:Glycolipid transfer protein domain-containing protein n=1 Tax=Manihot esculenta TaxID=3983 RepID=A0A2C9WGD6_MANES|nr:glycolipid transfer protein 3 isoform X3 [Manihot esculenta]